MSVKLGCKAAGFPAAKPAKKKKSGEKKRAAK